MSVLIKGMKKPKDCYSCPFAHNGWPDEWEMHCLFLDRQVGYFGKKLKVPKDCPLVEVSDPCAQSEQRWIPCSERLPEERDWYLGIFKEPDTGWINPIPFICDYLLGNKTEATTKEGWILKNCTDREEYIDYYFNLECVAWMPLPDPYEEHSIEEFMYGQDPGDPEDGSL